MIFPMYFLMERILFALFGRKNQLVVKQQLKPPVTSKLDTVYKVQIRAPAEVCE